MKPYQLRGVDHMVSRQIVEERAAKAAAPAPPPQARPNRRQRQKAKAFNRQLQRRLAKDGTAATVKVLPDGGIHVNIDAKKMVADHVHGPGCQHGPSPETIIIDDQLKRDLDTRAVAADGPHGVIVANGPPLIIDDLGEAVDRGLISPEIAALVDIDSGRRDVAAELRGRTEHVMMFDDDTYFQGSEPPQE